MTGETILNISGDVPATPMYKKGVVSNAIVTFDTETSKSKPNEWNEKEQKWIPVPNYVVAWSMCIRIDNENQVIYGHTPSELVEYMTKLKDALKNKVFMYAHNLAYDWQFIKHACYKAWGFPTNFLATKTHYPIEIEFSNGIVFRDSYILAQRSLDKWAKDLNTEHQKAVGSWDYDKIRTQHEDFTDEEIKYISYDVEVLAECLDKCAKIWYGEDATIASLPLTATGKIRKELRQFASERMDDPKSTFDKYKCNYAHYQRLERVYHGGYTHANRFHIGEIIKGKIVAYDFASSYPYCMIAKKFPTGRFRKMKKLDGIELHTLLDGLHEDETIIGKLVITNGQLRDDVQMPFMQESKIMNQFDDDVEVESDNGRLLSWSGTIGIELTDISMRLVEEQYDYDYALVYDIGIAKLDYLPSWFRDFVWSKWTAKCQLKGGDPILYGIAKSDVNSLYGMCVQKAIPNDIIEDYDTGIYTINSQHSEEEFKKNYQLNKGKILPYVWGIYITEWATWSLFELGKLAGTWLYSDTDSCYGLDWDEDGLNEYNEKRKSELRASGYGEVKTAKKDYYLGVAELDGIYQEFTTLGCKRYCVRKCDDEKTGERGQLKITVAGVPKRAVSSLGDDISNFRKGFTFRGADSGKLTHCYGKGNLGERIDGLFWTDLIECDYLLDETAMNSRIIARMKEVLYV